MENLTKKQIIDMTLSHEGGYVNDPDDRGGETNRGITKAMWDKHGDGTPMRDITYQQAFDFFDRVFYQPLLIDTIKSTSPDVANNFFDACVNCGRVGGTRVLQDTINGILDDYGATENKIIADGYIGSKTLGALTIAAAFVDFEILEYEFKSMLIVRYRKIVANRPSQAKYIKGWLNRVESNL